MNINLNKLPKQRENRFRTQKEKSSTIEDMGATIPTRGRGSGSEAVLSGKLTTCR
jgi:hypothetical protein